MTREYLPAIFNWLRDRSLLHWGAISLAAVIITLMLFRSDQTVSPLDAEDLRGPEEPDGFIVAGVYRSFDQQGHLSTRLESERAEQFDAERLVVMQSPRGVIFERESRLPWSIQAREGNYRMDEETLELNRDVLVERSGPEGRRSTLETSHLVLDNHERIVHTEAPVTLRDELGTTEAIGMRGWIDDRIVELKKDVRGEYRRP